jgi:hypothetical protein
LQVFRRLEASRTPYFTRERSQVRNPPRPLQKVRKLILAGTLPQAPQPQPARSGQ